MNNVEKLKQLLIITNQANLDIETIANDVIANVETLFKVDETQPDKDQEYKNFYCFGSTLIDNAAMVVVGKGICDIEVDFVGGGHSKYHNVPLYIWNDWIMANSAGRFFNLNLRGRYKEGI